MNGTSRISRSGRLAAWPLAALLLVGGLALLLGTGVATIRTPWDLGLLVALSVMSYFAGTIALPALRIDSSLVLAFTAVVLTGPLGALAVTGIPELIRPVAERNHVRRIATLANLASFVWAPLACWMLLLALPISTSSLAARCLVYSVAVAAMVVVQVAITRGIVAGLVDGTLISGWRTELRVLVAALALCPFAVLTAALLPFFGVLALVVVAAAEALLSALVRVVSWTPRAGGLTVPQARARYAAAISSRMSLSRSQRRVLLAAARSGTGRVPLWLSPHEHDQVPKVLLLAGLWSRHDEAHDDCFARLGPAEMGVESRVLLVADAWARLTAKGSDEIEHRRALITLHNHPRRYDREIVAVARGLLSDADGGAPCPRMPHTRELSRRVAQLKPAA
jgi:hypothetical protein